MSIVTTIALAYWAFSAGLLLAWMRLAAARPRPLHVIAATLWPVTGLIGLVYALLSRLASLLATRRSAGPL